jgi:hypothetical protein
MFELLSRIVVLCELVRARRAGPLCGRSLPSHWENLQVSPSQGPAKLLGVRWVFVSSAICTQRALTSGKLLRTLMRRPTPHKTQIQIEINAMHYRPGLRELEFCTCMHANSTSLQSRTSRRNFELHGENHNTSAPAGIKALEENSWFGVAQDGFLLRDEIWETGQILWGGAGFSSTTVDGLPE